MIGVSENIAVTDSPGVTSAPPDLELFFGEPINPIMVENGFQVSFHIALANGEPLHSSDRFPLAARSPWE